MSAEIVSLYLWQMADYARHGLPAGLGYFAEALFLLWSAKLIRDWTTRGVNDDAEITGRDNLAFGLYTAGYYLGVGLVVTGVLLGESDSFLRATLEILLYGLTGILFMATSYAVSDRIYLRGFPVMRELVAGNQAVAAFLVGRFLFAGLISMASLHGQGTWFTCFVAYILAEAGCWIAFQGYCRVTPYDDLGEIRAGNTAMGIVVCGIFAALGILGANALWDDFLGFDVMLVDFALWFFGGTAVLLVFRLAGSRILFPKSSLVEEIHRDKNRGAAAIMFTSYIFIAALIALSF